MSITLLDKTTRYDTPSSYLVGSDFIPDKTAIFDFRANCSADDTELAGRIGTSGSI